MSSCIDGSVVKPVPPLEVHIGQVHFASWQLADQVSFSDILQRIGQMIDTLAPSLQISWPELIRLDLLGSCGFGIGQANSADSRLIANAVEGIGSELF
jgi:hypothetical protein